MTGFTDLVAQAQPALAGGGASALATEGRTWSWTFTDITDTAGTPVDLATGITGTCTVYDKTSGATVTTLTYTGGTGQFTLSKVKAATAGLAAGELKGRLCRWALSLDNGTVSLEVWGPTNSTLTILSEA